MYFYRVKHVILLGSCLPLLVYIIWEWLALGIIPLEGPYGIIAGYHKGADGTELLSHLIPNGVLPLLALTFSFFAIITSFLGVSLSLVDFLSDGLHIQKAPLGKTLLCVLVFLPPLIFTLTDPSAFLNALEYAGAFGVVVLVVLFPALMAWSGRYHQHRTSSYQAPGGKLGILLAITFSLCVIAIEIAHKLHLF